jgi:CheY-like chemotaxis protein
MASSECRAEAEKRQAVTSQGDALPTSSVRPLHVLLAEDTPAIQKLVVHMLTLRGHTVEIAENGSLAVELVMCRSFDVALMDLQMPVMGGLEAVAAIRKLPDEVKARLPMIALTLDGDGPNCMAGGMDGFVRKPIVRQELIEMVEGLAAKLVGESAESPELIEEL